MAPHCAIGCGPLRCRQVVGSPGTDGVMGLSAPALSIARVRFSPCSGGIRVGRRLFCSGFVAGLVLLVGNLAAQESGTSDDGKVINWALNDFPPFILVEGDLPGDGFVDAALRHIVAGMPEYTHRFEVVSVSRALGLMAQGERVCHPSLLRSAERERVATYSERVHFVLPHHVVLPRTHLSRIQAHTNAQGEVDVDSLLADGSLLTSINDLRVFSPQINRALERFGDASHVQRSGGHFVASFRQLEAGWIDYLFAYPVEPGWYQSRGLVSGTLDLVYLPIAGGEPFTLGFVACTRGTWGERIVARIDEIVRDAGPRPPWVKRQLDLSDAEGGKRLEQQLERHRPFGH